MNELETPCRCSRTAQTLASRSHDGFTHFRTHSLQSACRTSRDRRSRSYSRGTNTVGPLRRNWQKETAPVPCKAHATRPRRAARSARHPVKVEIVGSNPIGGARFQSANESARYANWQSGQAQTLAICGFDSHSCHLFDEGWCSSRRSVEPSPKRVRRQARGSTPSLPIFRSFCTAVPQDFLAGAEFSRRPLRFRISSFGYRLRPNAALWPRRLLARTPPSQGGEAGSIPVGANSCWSVVGCRLSVIRQSRRPKPTMADLSLFSSPAFRVRTDEQTPRRGRCPIGSHKAGWPGSIPGPGTLRAGRCSAEFHTLGGRGSTPGPAIFV
jgi:hypothetical protein